MSPLHWLRRLFTPDENTNEEQESVAMREMDEESSFAWNEHMRILMAILVALISALTIWWILA